MNKHLWRCTKNNLSLNIVLSFSKLRNSKLNWASLLCNRLLPTFWCHEKTVKEIYIYFECTNNDDMMYCTTKRFMNSILYALVQLGVLFDNVSSRYCQITSSLDVLQSFCVNSYSIEGVDLKGLFVYFKFYLERKIVLIRSLK